MNKTGFGFLRLPLKDSADENSVDIAAVCALADRFIELGGNYFDTAYTYLGGNSELALREAVVKRHPRQQLRIADKLPSWMLKCPEDCDRIFTEQLERCGVDYFDVYLLHGLDVENYEACEKHGAFSFLERLKADGLALSSGFSFHDSPELLEKILTEHPELDIVQLQINYLDWESISIQSRHCYEIASGHGKRVIVMEPVKGGSLANLPAKAAEALRAFDPDAGAASWAIRFAQDLEAVEVVLSGMNAMEQIEENMRDRPSLTCDERTALEQAAAIIHASTAVACTGCGYCADACPMRIPIQHTFALYNEYFRSPGELWKMEYRYGELIRERKPASSCLSCGACERRCPQGLHIIENLRKAAKVFEKQKEG